MADINEPTSTWRNPYWGTLSGDYAKLRPIFESLSNFLARPVLANGIELGDGTPGTKDETTGVETPPPTKTITKTTIEQMEDALAGLGTSLDDVYATLATMDADITALETAPIDGTRITDNSIATPKLQANSVTATQLAAMNIGVGKWIASTSYNAGVSGWIIAADGTAEFNNVTVRGTLVSGGGAVVADVNGVQIASGTSGVNRIRWLLSGALKGSAYVDGSGVAFLDGVSGVQLLYNGSTRLTANATGVIVNGSLSTNTSGQDITAGRDLISGARVTVGTTLWVAGTQIVDGSGNVYGYSINSYGGASISGALSASSVTTTNISGAGSTISFQGGNATISSGGAISGGSLAVSGGISAAGGNGVIDSSGKATLWGGLVVHGQAAFDVTTTGSAANAYLDGFGVIYKSTSSAKYKSDVAPIADAYDTSVIYDLQPISYLSRCHDGDIGGPDDPTTRYVSFLAEDVLAAAPILASVDHTGDAVGINWNGITTFLLAEVQRLRADLDALQGA